MAKFKVQYFVLADHPVLKHCRMSDIYFCEANDETEAKLMASLDADRKYNRVKQEDFKPSPNEAQSKYWLEGKQGDVFIAERLRT